MFSLMHSNPQVHYKARKKQLLRKSSHERKNEYVREKGLTSFCSGAGKI